MSCIRNLLLTLVFLGLVACKTLAGYPATYSAEDIEAWVIDAETKEPVADVVVVARWVLQGGMHTDEVGSLKIMETVTGPDGRFYFPAWGPEFRPPRTFLWNQDPELLIFKPGYRFVSLYNTEHFKARKHGKRSSTYDGKKIEMERFTRTAEKYVRHLHFLDTSLSWAHRVAECKWKLIPRMIIAVEKQKYVAHRLGKVRPIDVDVQAFRNYLVNSFTLYGGRDPCGAKEFFTKWIKQENHVVN